MGGLEGMLTGLSDELAPLIKRYRYGREVLTAVVVFSACLFAIPNITNVCRLNVPSLIMMRACSIPINNNNRGIQAYLGFNNAIFNIEIEIFTYEAKRRNCNLRRRSS